MARWSSALQCEWESWLPGSNGELILSLPAMQCCDMTGCLLTAAELDPCVTTVRVLSGGVPDVTYRLVNTPWQREWHAEGDWRCTCL